MNEKPTLKKQRNFYGEQELLMQNDNDYVRHYGPHEITDDVEDIDVEEISDEAAIEQMVKNLISNYVKEYCEQHFEEIIAGALVLHDLKQKRKIVKASKLNK